MVHEIICWQCKMIGKADIDEEDLTCLIGVCPNCIAPGLTDYICNHGHIHTTPFKADLKTYDGLKEVEYIFDQMEKLLPESVLPDSSRREILDVVKNKKHEVKRLMLQYMN